MAEGVLVATLGFEPQVVTLTLDKLGERGIGIDEVLVVHTAGRPVMAALRALEAEFARMGQPPCTPAPVRDAGRPVADAVTEAQIQAFTDTLHRTLVAQKRRGRAVHLSISGGRKSMAVQGMVVAQRLFDRHDQLWHLLTEGWRPGDARVMHVRPQDDVTLIAVPVIRWRTMSPVRIGLDEIDEPWRAVALQEAQQRERLFADTCVGTRRLGRLDVAGMRDGAAR
jgi:CRISPR-associated protein Csx14